MNLRQKILRLFQPDTERRRIEYRAAVACASAHAEELDRCVRQLVSDPPIVPPMKEKRHA